MAEKAIPSMPYGKHKGKTLDQIPDDYLLWVYENNNPYGDIKVYIEDNLDAIRKNAAELKTEYQKNKG